MSGFFENGTTTNLYEEGETILGTGFNGQVTISYVGGTGNDVVLNLLASPLARADFDEDGDVDGADFLAWQRGFGTTTPSAAGDADGSGVVDASDLAIWTQEFGTVVSSGTSMAGAVVPEPETLQLLVSAGLALAQLRWLW